jgi:hypothetical protein
MLLDLVPVLLVRVLDSRPEIWVRKLNNCLVRDWLLFLYVPSPPTTHFQFLTPSLHRSIQRLLFSLDQSLLSFAPLRADMQGAFNQITSTLDEKTKTDTHPGIVTQATSAFQTGVHKVDDFLSDVSSSPIR